MMQQFNEFSGNNAPKQESFEDIDIRLQDEIKTLTKELESVKGLIASLKKLGKSDIGKHINEQKSLEEKIYNKRREQIENLFKSGAAKLANTGVQKSQGDLDKRYTVSVPKTGETDLWDEVEDGANKSTKRPEDFSGIPANDRNFIGTQKIDFGGNSRKDRGQSGEGRRA